jgi:hypothetical protein
MDTQRSPLTINRTEALVAALVLVVVELWIYCALLGTGPYFPDAVEDDPSLLTWLEEEMREIYSTFALPLGSVLLIPSVSLVRYVRKDVRHFSQLGHLASAWPLVTSVFLSNTLFIWLLSTTLGGLLLLVGVALGIIASVRALLTKRHLGDLVSIPLNVAWGALYLCLLDRWAEAAIW